MRRLDRVIVVVVVVGYACPAFAGQHLMRVGEVMLSTGGDPTAQFVEFQSPGEAYPNTPYRLEVFDADASLVNMVDMPDVTNGTTRHYVASNTAPTAPVVGDTVLPFALPANGQACFVDTDGTTVHCVAWGCINTLVTSQAGTDAVPAPPDGQSVQRQGNGAYQLATPTPKAANTTGVTATPCPGPDAGPQPDAGPTPDAGPAPDAGVVVDASPDAPDSAVGTNPDAGTDDDDDEGCGCRAGTSTSSGLGALLLLGLTVLLVRRRRR